MEKAELTKVKVLRYIAEHQPVSVKHIKENLRISIGSIYHHLAGLSSILEQDYRKRYQINPVGMKLLQDNNNDYQKVVTELEENLTNELMVRPIKISKKRLEKLRNLKDSPIESRTNRNIYDLMAMILASKQPVFTITWVINQVGVSHSRLTDILSFMKDKKLIADVTAEELPKNTHGKYLRITGRGFMFLKRYQEMLATLD